MFKKIKWIALNLFFVMLIACTEDFSYTYLIQHPSQLKRELEHCQSDKDLTKEREAYCEIVNSAASTVSSLINDIQQNPEKFGQEIINTQMAMVKTKELLEEAKLKLKAVPPSTKDYEQANAAVMLAEKEFAEQENKVKAMLAVIGMSSPE